jgi:hypothetical protein
MHQRITRTVFVAALLAWAAVVPAQASQAPGAPRGAVAPAADGARAAVRQGAAAAPAGVPAALAIIDQAIQAKGGLDTLKAVKTLKAVAKTTIDSPQGPMTTETTTYVVYPDKLRVEARLPIGEVVQVYAGDDTVWVKDPLKGVVIPPASARRDFRNSVQRDVLPLLLRAHAGELTLRLAEAKPGADESRSVRAVELSGGGIEPVTLFIDTTTGMVVKERYELPNGAGTADEVFTDYHAVDGVEFAFDAALQREGLPVMHRVVSEMKVNVPIDPALFAKPARRP